MLLCTHHTIILPYAPDLTSPVCPTCANLLRVSRVPPLPHADPSSPYVAQNRFECLTCPYQFVIKKRYFERKPLKQRAVDDVLGGEGAWDNVEKAKVVCPIDKCRNDVAFWYALQIRSADEPMTNFYKVCISRKRER
jgi:DNA-directed RNA polymerase III subunit RPC11